MTSELVAMTELVAKKNSQDRAKTVCLKYFLLPMLKSFHILGDTRFCTLMYTVWTASRENYSHNFWNNFCNEIINCRFSCFGDQKKR